MSSAKSSAAGQITEASEGGKKQPQQQKAPGGNGKKQATPSQKRANHEKEKQRQHQHSGQQEGQKAQRPQGPGGKSGGRELDAKVSRLSDKNDSCREKVDSNLNEFSRRAVEIKNEIGLALDRQAEVLAGQDSVSRNVEQLRNRMLELSEQPLVEQAAEGDKNGVAAAEGDHAEGQATIQSDVLAPAQCNNELDGTNGIATEVHHQSPASKRDNENQEGAAEVSRAAQQNGAQNEVELAIQDEQDKLIPGNCFEPLTARLDPKTKFITLKASLERHFVKAPELLEPICNRLLMLSRQIDLLVQQNDRNLSEIAKLNLIKTKLGDLCRELQKSNNQIRIESLGMIKSEQQRAKEQAGKIQATLAGVMKLFDENQQRNLSLKQENVDLQTKLKALLDHCGQWEQCVDTALKQRDIENRLIKTELSRLNLVRAEEQERFLKEKQELLQVVEIMKTNQGKIEDKEAKLRSDLTNYASKYDECQEIIQKGLGKFQVESKRMLKQIEKSRQDYVVLLNKYESSNKKIKELLEEKQTCVKSMSQANKKVETLERLCRSLKQENDRLTAGDSAPARTLATDQIPKVTINGHPEETVAPE